MTDDNENANVPSKLEIGLIVAMWKPEHLKGESNMHMLYDSDTFVVVHMQADMPLKATDSGLSSDIALPQLARHGFEIVDKRSGKEVYLDGSWAELFQQQISAWQEKTPTQDEVEDTLERYAELAQNPVLVH